MEFLVGYTGFVGSNLKDRHDFCGLFNTGNITDAFGTNPDLCVYAGVRAEKYIANSNPELDYELIRYAIDNIKKINPKRLVLISTIDVYKNPVNVSENTRMDTDGLQAYGLNRYNLEQWVSDNIDDHLIVRLPGLFGKNIKKNFIFDLIHVIPSLLSESKFRDLSSQDALVNRYYVKQGNGFYKCRAEQKEERNLLRQAFERMGFTALNFTDSRAVFQFYNLSYLWEHIQIALKNNIQLLNIAVEPLSVSEIYFGLKEKTFKNEIGKTYPHYDFKTIHDDIFHGENGYIFKKDKVLKDISDFVAEASE